jgi:hypothetical protein
LTGLHVNNLPNGEINETTPHNEAQNAGNAASLNQLNRWFFPMKCASMDIAEIGIADTPAEMIANRTVDIDDDCSAFDAGLAREMKVPTVDAAQGCTRTPSFLENSFG